MVCLILTSNNNSMLGLSEAPACLAFPPEDENMISNFNRRYFFKWCSSSLTMNVNVYCIVLYFGFLHHLRYLS